MSRSSGSKSFFGPEAMLDLDDQLDYEPDGGEEDEGQEGDSDVEDYNRNSKRSNHDLSERKQYSEKSNRSFLQDQDSRQQIPEPSGQEYEDSTIPENGLPDYQDSPLQTGSETTSFTYGTELVKTPSLSSSFRDRLNYNSMHINVKPGSFRSRYSSNRSNCQYVYSDAEPQFSDSDESALEDDVTSLNQGNEQEFSENYQNEYIPDDNLENQGPESPNNESQHPYTQYYYKDTVQNSDDVNQNYQEHNLIPNKPSTNNATDILPKRNSSLNFSIKVMGTNRLVLPKKLTPVRKPKKPWKSNVNRFFPDVVQLRSTDDIIRFLPDKCDIKNRVGGSSSIRSRLGSTSDSSGHVGGSQESQTSSPSAFKIPLKRPPTRPKSFKICVDSQKRKVTPANLSPIKPQEDKEDDMVSLFASSCLLVADDYEEQDNNQERRNNLFCVKDEPLSYVASSDGTERARIERTKLWVTEAAEGPSKVDPKAPVPAIYRGLCYRYFFQNHCPHMACRLSHFLDGPNTQIRDLPSLNNKDLEEAYRFAKDHPSLYGKIYKHFAEAFAVKDMKSELINMVYIIFEESLHGINHEEGLSNVLDCLQKTNLSVFEDTVDYLLLHIGLKKYPTLGHTLLEIICKKAELVKYWPVVRKLIIAGEKMSDKLGSKFIVNIMRPPVDYKVCRDFYDCILKYKCVDLPKIANFIREPFLKICTPTQELQASIERNLTKERFNFESRQQNSFQFPQSYPKGLNIPTDFSKPPPTFGENNLGHGRPNLNLNYLPPREFGSGLNNKPDFASISLQNTSFAVQNNNFANPRAIFTSTSQPLIDGFSKEANNSNRHDVDLRFRRSEPRHNSYNYERRRSSSDEELEQSSSSTSDQSPSFTKPSLLNSRSNKRHYNREGLQYDPADDYAPPSKKIHVVKSVKPISRNLDRHYRNPDLPYQLPTSNEGNINHPPATMTEFDRLRTSGHNVQQAGPSRNDHVDQEVRPLPQKARLINRKRIEFSARNNDGAVSSSTDARLSDEKPPEIPQFGKLYFDPNYEFNVSLHNLYLQAIDNVDIDEEDVHKLNDCVKMSDGKIFLELINKYKGPKTVQNFISMTLAHLKGMNQLCASTYERLLDNIEKENRWYYGNINIRVILEVITMNLLFELQKRNTAQVAQAANRFLQKFSNWDSLVTSRVFIHHNGLSIIGRYLFIAKILNYSKPELTYEILVCPTLHLLDKYEIWPYHPPCPIPEIFTADLDLRNTVIVSFLKTGYQLNIMSVIHFYKTAFRKGVWNLDVKPYVEPMVIDLINKHQKSSLKSIYNEIDVFLKYIGKDTLRALLITMYRYLSESEAISLYEKCVEKKVYQKLVMEDVNGEMLVYQVEIKTNMSQSEIELIIKYYFHKMDEIKQVPSRSTSLVFEIKLPGTDQPSTKQLPILNKNRSVDKTRDIIIQFLNKHCSIKGKVISPTLVEVEKEKLVHYLDNIWT